MNTTKAFLVSAEIYNSCAILTCAEKKRKQEKSLTGIPKAKFRNEVKQKRKIETQGTGTEPEK